MDFFTVLALGISLYCLYQISSMKEKKKDDGFIQQERERLLMERIQHLKGKQGDIIVKMPLFFVDIPYSIKCEIRDADKEWVMISTIKGKKEVKKIIRISVIKDVKEIL